MSYNVKSAMTMRAYYCLHNPGHVQDLVKTITQTLSLSLPSNNLNQEYFWMDLRCSLIRQKGYVTFNAPTEQANSRVSPRTHGCRNSTAAMMQSVVPEYVHCRYQGNNDPRKIIVMRIINC